MPCGVCRQLNFKVLRKRLYVGEIKTFGVVLKETYPGYRHAGVVVSSLSGGGLRVLHLAGHYEFSNDEFDDTYALIPNCNFSQGELDYLAEKAMRLWEKNGANIAYGLDFDGSDPFDLDLKFMGDDGRGLTCATFVLAFLRKCAFPILDVESWKFREEDEKFQKIVYNHYAQKLTEEQAARMKASVANAARFRPEEVVACFSHYDEDLIDFKQGQKFGTEILTELSMSPV